MRRVRRGRRLLVERALPAHRSAGRGGDRRAGLRRAVGGDDRRAAARRPGRRPVRPAPRGPGRWCADRGGDGAGPDAAVGAHHADRVHPRRSRCRHPGPRGLPGRRRAAGAAARAGADGRSTGCCGSASSVSAPLARRPGRCDQPAGRPAHGRVRRYRGPGARPSPALPAGRRGREQLSRESETERRNPADDPAARRAGRRSLWRPGPSTSWPTWSAGPRATRPAGHGIVAVDGRSASGKSTLTAGCSGTCRTRPWSTPTTSPGTSRCSPGHLLADGVLRPLRRGEAVTFQPPAWPRHRTERCGTRARRARVRHRRGSRRQPTRGRRPRRRHRVGPGRRRRGRAARHRPGHRGGCQRRSRADRRVLAAVDDRELAFFDRQQPWTRAHVVVNGSPPAGNGEDDVALAPGTSRLTRPEAGRGRAPVRWSGRHAGRRDRATGRSTERGPRIGGGRGAGPFFRVEAPPGPDWTSAAAPSSRSGAAAPAGRRDPCRARRGSGDARKSTGGGRVARPSRADGPPAVSTARRGPR